MTAGEAIQQLRSWRDLYSWQAVLLLLLFAAISILPAGISYVAPGLLRRSSDAAQTSGAQDFVPPGAPNVKKRTGSRASVSLLPLTHDP